MKTVINIVNFIRQSDPREPEGYDMITPVKEQIALLRELGLRGTFLLQYDALTDPVYVELMRGCPRQWEIGLWMETVQPQVEAAGLPWRGRYPWDWHNDVGFLIGYTPDERRRIIDVTMERFRQTFGYYPASVGSWHLDAVSVAYMAQRYHIRACCICRDQVGTDGYTMQGGYYNQAYYPSVNNLFCPAGSAQTQIPVPVFRMLGSDPIYAYDYQTMPYGFSIVPTLEPVGLGGDTRWADWFLEEICAGNGLSFQYTQAGQENSFSWPPMAHGLTHQLHRIRALADAGRAEVMTLGESGVWYAGQFPLTPPATLTGLTDWQEKGRQSVWYSSRFYRTNLLREGGTVCFRDLYIFDDRYPEHYLHSPCTTTACELRNLPVMDGTLYTAPGSPRTAGIYLTAGGRPICWDDLQYAEEDGCAVITLTAAGKQTHITLAEDSITLHSDILGLTLTPQYDRAFVYGGRTDADAPFGHPNTVLTFLSSARAEDTRVTFCFDGFAYGFTAESGRFDARFACHAQEGTIRLRRFAYPATSV